jgi:all-trans-8'-apo-beta-carotenal 15,15'-oxygenase
LGAAMACAATAHSAQASPKSPQAFQAEFAKALSKNPRLTPLKGIQEDLFTDQLRIEGRMPKSLTGRFYRNGPGLFERGDQRYQHWFAGDGMVQQFVLDGQAVQHRGRFVQTSKFKKEAAAKQFLLPAFGSNIAASERVTGPDSMNVANTNVIEHNGRLLALWEGGSAYELDPQTLATRGPVTWKDGWAQMPFSAHPKVDRDGHLWNIGGGATGFVVYHLGPDGKLISAQTTKLPIDPLRSGGMIHDMAVTQSYLVVPIPPVVIRWQLIAQGLLGDDVMGITPNEPLRVWVAPKDNIAAARIFELPPEMVFHVGNAHEEGGELVLSYIGGGLTNFLSGAAVDVMRGATTIENTAQLRVARLNLATGKASATTFETNCEFPRVNPRFVGLNARWAVTPAGWRTGAHQAPGSPPAFHGVQLQDMRGGAVQRFDYGPNMTPEEHLIVPKPGASGELDAWVLGTAFDVSSQRTCVNVFEAKNLADGPIARAWLPYWLPLGFHGNFTAA